MCVQLQLASTQVWCLENSRSNQILAREAGFSFGRFRDVAVRQGAGVQSTDMFRSNGIIYLHIYMRLYEARLLR